MPTIHTTGTWTTARPAAITSGIMTTISNGNSTGIAFDARPTPTVSSTLEGERRGGGRAGGGGGAGVRVGGEERRGQLIKVRWIVVVLVWCFVAATADRCCCSYGVFFTLRAFFSLLQKEVSVAVVPNLGCRYTW